MAVTTINNVDDEVRSHSAFERMVQSPFADKLNDRHSRPAGPTNTVKQISTELETLRVTRSSAVPPGARGEAGRWW